MKNFEILVPAGQYYISDPCYIIKDEDWYTLLDSCNFFNNPIGDIKGFKCYASSTAFGDGEYFDQNGNSYSVDSGLIGLVPVDYTEHNTRSIIISNPSNFGYKDGVIYLEGYFYINTDNMY